MRYGEIYYKKSNVKKIYDYPLKNTIYSPEFFGFRNIVASGKYVRLAIIDSGLPVHKNIKTDIYKSKNFTTTNSIFDTNGHSTALSGIISSDGKGGIKGIATEVDLYFAKALFDDGSGNHNNVIDALLWSIERDVDIVLMSFGSPSEHQGLKDAIKKVYNSGIAMFAAGGDFSSRTKDVDFPARYDEVFSVGYSNNITTAEIIKYKDNCKGIILPSQDFETTYSNSKFVTIKGSSMCAAAIAGVGVLVHQVSRTKKIDVKNPQIMYNEICKLLDK